MGEGSVFRRIGPPVLTLLVVTAAAWLAYLSSRWIAAPAAQALVATVSVATYFGALAFGALYVYLRAERRGARRGERVLACSVTPVAWMTKEVLRVGTVHPPLDALVFYLNPLHWTFAGVVVAEMGVAELVCRARRRRAGAPIAVWTPGPLVAAIVPPLVIAWLQLHPEDAAATFFAFLQLYMRLVHGTTI